MLRNASDHKGCVAFRLAVAQPIAGCGRARRDCHAVRLLAALPYWGASVGEEKRSEQPLEGVSAALGFLPDLAPVTGRPIEERTNPNGGAIALGHPIGACGAIVTLKAAYEMKCINGRHALATMCVGGGQGIALLLAAA